MLRHKSVSVLLWPQPNALLPCGRPGSAGLSRTSARIAPRVTRLGPSARPHRAGGNRGRPAGGGGRPGCGRAPGGRGASPSSARLCESHRQWAKTDGRDARAVAHCAAAVRPTPRPLPEAQTDALRALLARRRQLGARRTAETNRLSSARPRARSISGASRLARPASGAPGRGLGHHPTGQSRLARARDAIPAVSQAVDPCVPGRCGSTCPSGGPCVANAWRRESAWPPRTVTVVPCGATAPSGADGRMCGPPGIWGRWSRCGTSRAHSLFRPAVPGGQSQESGPDRLQAQALDDSARHGETPQALARAGGAERITTRPP